MYPFSYTSLKIIHDQKIQEALEQQRLHAGLETRRQGLVQAFGTFLAHFNNQSGMNTTKRWSEVRLILSDFLHLHHFSSDGDPEWR